jgi:hypothetical protein
MYTRRICLAEPDLLKPPAAIRMDIHGDWRHASASAGHGEDCFLPAIGGEGKKMNSLT